MKKGAKGFHILAPCTRTITEKNEDGEKVSKQIVTGFRGQAVFRVEDTDGQELNYQALELPPLPLLDVAEAWGIDTRAVHGGEGFYGCFSPGQQVIRLASPEEKVFFHELAHAGHHRIHPLKGGQRWDQEIVSELSAAALCRLVGCSTDNLGDSYRYIEHYASKAEKDPLAACAEVIADVDKVLRMILGAKQTVIAEV